MRVSKRRSNIEIIAEMLRIGEKGAGKTEIMYSANMSYTQIQKYLGYLLTHGFIDRIEIGNPVVTYQVTEKGLGLLRNIEGIMTALDFEDINGL